MRNTINSPVSYDVFPPVQSVPRSLKQDFDVILNKPYFVKNFTWNTTGTPSAGFTSLGQSNFPSGAYNANLQLKAPYLYSAKSRATGCYIIQVAGTPQHQGILLASVQPVQFTTVNRQSFNSMLQAPHAFLAANESTPICLEIPFYSPTRLISTHWEAPSPASATIISPNYNGDIACLNLMIINPLVAPTSGSVSITVSVHVKYTHLEFYMPANKTMTYVAQSRFLGAISSVFDSVAASAKTITGDFIDNLRGALRAYTGLHNPNHPFLSNRVVVDHRNFSNLVDGPTYFEKLDPYANHDRIVEDSIFYTNKDEMLVQNIISKPQYVSSFSVTTSTEAGKVLFSRPITPMMEPYANNATSRFSSTPLQTLAIMSKMWRGDLELIIQSDMTNFHYAKLLVALNYVNDTQAYAKVPQLSDVVGMLTTTLEFSGGNQVQTVDLPYCSEFEELPTCLDAAMNAMSHGMLYAYLLQPLVSNGSVATTINFNVYIRAKENFSFYGYGVERATFLAQSVLVEPEETILNNQKTVDVSTPFCNKFQPIVSMRDYVRRFQMGPTIYNQEVEGNKVGLMQVNIRDIIKTYSTSAVGTAQMARNFYWGFSGGLKFKVLIYGATTTGVRYFPPSPTIDNGGETFLHWYSSSIVSNDATVSAIAYPSRTLFDGGTDPQFSERNPGPLIEFTTSSKSLGTAFVRDESTPPLVLGLNSLKVEELEFCIPQMNVNDFVLTPLNYTSTSPLYNNDLGSLVINYEVITPTTIVDAAAVEPAISGSTKFNFMFAFADESRLGYNICCPSITPDTNALRTSLAGTYQKLSTAPFPFGYSPVSSCYIGIT